MGCGLRVASCKIGRIITYYFATRNSQPATRNPQTPNNELSKHSKS